MKITQFIPVLLTLLFIGLRYFSRWCISAEQACFRTVLDRIYLYSINPVFYFAVFFLPIAIILAFVPKTVFRSWLRFATWFVPFAIAFIVFTPDSNPNAIIELFSFYRDDAARLAGQVFSVISLVLIIWKWWKSRDSGQV